MYSHPRIGSHVAHSVLCYCGPLVRTVGKVVFNSFRTLTLHRDSLDRAPYTASPCSTSHPPKYLKQNILAERQNAGSCNV